MEDAMRFTASISFIVVLVLMAVPVLAGDIAVIKKGGPRPEASPDRASIYVVRPATMGWAIRIWAFADDMPLGVTKGEVVPTLFVHCKQEWSYAPIQIHGYQKVSSARRYRHLPAGRRPK